MKHLKKIFCALALSLSGLAAGQTALIDSSLYYTFSDGTSLSGSFAFASYVKEFLVFDSASEKGEYYSVHCYGDFDFETKYNLRCKDDRVYFSGLLQTENGDSFEISDLLIYDFNLNAGDSFRIYDSGSALDIELLIDSVRDVEYRDGKQRKTQFYSVLKGASNEYYSRSINFAALGLGSDFGLLPFKIRHREAPFWLELISVCEKNENLVYAANARFDQWGQTDYCNEAEIIEMIAKMKGSSIDDRKVQALRLFPNPSRSDIQVEGLTAGNYKIYDVAGQIVGQGVYERVIGTEALVAGCYVVLIENEGRLYVGRFLRE